MKLVEEVFGGNILKQHPINTTGKLILADSPYEYFMIRSSKEQNFKIENLLSFSIYYLSGNESIKIISSNNKELQLKQGDMAQVENYTAEIILPNDPIEILVAGTAETQIAQSTIEPTLQNDIKKVIKPWGYELWINGEHPNYALKEIFIKTGTKTSLQYHRMKRETNLLLSGKAKLHYKSNKEANNDQVTAQDISVTDLQPVTSVDVFPNHLHRLEAVTDVLLCEVSTPHLDDVVRISDDTNRTDGRIHTEHVKHS